MARQRKYPPLDVFLNSRQIGTLSKQSSGAIYFAYHSDWLNWQHALPVSLSLPLQEDRYSGVKVLAVFENLLPDNETIRNRVAAKFHAEGTDPYSLLAAIGRDCVGAMQFLERGDKPDPADQLKGTALSEEQIAQKLKSLSSNPLGLEQDRDFRISIAGAQEKTALLKRDNQWILPYGSAPTTHIFKTQIGQLSNGLDLTLSVENEYLCLKIARLYGLNVADATIEHFEGQTALVVERFDRKRLKDGQLIRIPQEDCCQALSITSAQKYQRDGGPGIEDIMKLLLASDVPARDRAEFFKANVLLWLLGATDGHAKNFSLALLPQGRFRLTPLYDIVSLQPSADDGQVRRNAYRLAMCVGNSNKYKVHDIRGRHLKQTGENVGLSSADIDTLFDEISDRSHDVLDKMTNNLPDNFPVEIVDPIKEGIQQRLQRLTSD